MFHTVMLDYDRTELCRFSERTEERFSFRDTVETPSGGERVVITDNDGLSYLLNSSTFLLLCGRKSVHLIPKKKAEVKRWRGNDQHRQCPVRYVCSGIESWWWKSESCVWPTRLSPTSPPHFPSQLLCVITSNTS
ncbi:hypothetical protein AMELA_G00070130 [Ameiurus melas]|uniref:Uncharacterized protein n=1 Tax=Ameiurus melas TaxID=219545 RepID=A0A7J6B7M4_AMEME|nr:hypothetical protein AMELA_G00070130 [Ameiurus melas]